MHFNKLLFSAAWCLLAGACGIPLQTGASNVPLMEMPPIPPGAPALQSSPTRSTIMQAVFRLSFRGSPGYEDEDYIFLLNPDRIIINEPAVSDYPGRVDQVVPALIFKNIGESLCREKYRPAFDPRTAYNQACGTLVDRTADLFILDYTFRSRGVDGVEVVYRSRVRMQRQALTCQAQLISFQRTFRNIPGMFVAPSAIVSSSCRGL